MTRPAVCVLLIALTGCVATDPVLTDLHPPTGYQLVYSQFGSCGPSHPWGYIDFAHKTFCYSDLRSYWHEKCHYEFERFRVTRQENAMLCGDLVIRR